MKELLIATKNKGKVRELAALLENLPLRIRSLDDFPLVIEPEETGLTFAENAALKATYYARQTGIPALADDSGLEVEALAGAPGVFSARYGGKGLSDFERTARLLKEVAAVPLSHRQAQFVCAMAIADRQGVILTSQEGICRGNLALNPAGVNGFGYDPIFIPDGFQQTFAELPNTVKHEISHRARATKKIIAFLRDFTAL